MTPPLYCPNCRAGLPAGARFCPNCGAPVDGEPVAQPIHPTPVQPRARRPWWIMGVPLAILAIGLLGWAILAGMPFGHREEQIQTLTQAPSDTIGEATGSSTTVSQIGETTMPPTTTTALTSAPPEPSTISTAPPPRIVISTAPPARPPIAPPPSFSTNPPMMSSTTSGREITADDAMNRLRAYLAANNPYPNANGCATLANPTYRNHGYAIDVRDTCAADSPLLGRWRVDAVTGGVYQQNDEGGVEKP